MTLAVHGGNSSTCQWVIKPHAANASDVLQQPSLHAVLPVWSSTNQPQYRVVTAGIILCLCACCLDAQVRAGALAERVATEGVMLQYAVDTKLDVCLSNIYEAVTKPPLLLNPFPRLLHIMRAHAAKLDLFQVMTTHTPSWWPDVAIWHWKC